MASWIVEHLHPELKITNIGTPIKPASRSNIRAVLERFSTLPTDIVEDYLDIMQFGEYFCISSKDEQEKFRLYINSTLDVLDYHEWYDFLKEDMSDCLFFGDEGGAEWYFLGTHEGRSGVYIVPAGAAMWEHARYVAPSIKAMLCDGVGWANQSEGDSG